MAKISADEYFLCVGQHISSDHLSNRFPSLDISTLGNNLRANMYKTVGDFAKDATKIFNNARYYNPKNSPVFLCAEKLEKFFVQQLKELTSGK